MHIHNPYTDKEYAEINFKVSRDASEYYVAFIPECGNCEKVILVAGKTYYVVDIKCETTRMEGKCDADGNRKTRDYITVHIENDSVPEEHVNGLCLGMANYRAEMFAKDNIYAKSNVYYGDKKVVQEFFYLSNGEIFNEHFERKRLSEKRENEVNEIPISFNIAFGSIYVPVQPLSSFMSISSEDGHYLFGRVAFNPERVSNPQPYRHYYVFVKGQTAILFYVKVENFIRERILDEKYFKYKFNYEIKLDENEAFDEKDVLALANCFMAYFVTIAIDGRYTEKNYKIYYGDKLIVKEF